jgi:hypothetical protein
MNLEIKARGEGADHLRPCHQEMGESIYNVSPFSESDSKGDQEVFMVGQNDASGDQTKE